MGSAETSSVSSVITKKGCFAKKLFKVIWLKHFSKASCSDTNKERFSCRCSLISWELSALNYFKSLSTSIFCSILVASKRLLVLLATKSNETPDAFFNSLSSKRKVKTRFSKLSVSVTISGLALLQAYQRFLLNINLNYSEN